MITRLTVQNFKKFQHLDVRMAPLTVLTGRNGGGKSSVIQSLLIIHRAARGGTSPGTTIQLNDAEGLNLGEASEVFHRDAQGTDIRLSAYVDGEESAWAFDAGLDRRQYLAVIAAPNTSPFRLDMRGGRGFAYLAAERLGPRDSQATDPRALDEMGIGAQGQFIAHFLSQFARDDVRSNLLYADGDASSTLSKQTEYWLSDILSPVEIDAQWALSANVATLRFKSPGVRSDWVRPANAGFGFSYAIPIVVAGLAAYPDGLLLVENPEAHLDPRAQSRMGRFLSVVARSGVQVVVETHSDHVLNGIRRAVLHDESPPAAEVAIHFFGDGDANPVEIAVKPSGSLTTWPNGFFDQFERDLADLAKRPT